MNNVISHDLILRFISYVEHYKKDLFSEIKDNTNWIIKDGNKILFPEQYSWVVRKKLDEAWTEFIIKHQ